MTVKLAVPANEFGRMLSNAAEFASKETMRPILCEVELTATETELTAVATDSYVLYRERITLSEPSETVRVFRMTAADARTVAKAIAGLKLRYPTVLVVEVDDETVHLVVGSQTFDLRACEGQYPNWSTLIPSEDAFHGQEYVAWPAHQLTKLAKIKADNGRDGPTIKFRFTEDRKASVFSVGEMIDGLIMPSKTW